MNNVLFHNVCQLNIGFNPYLHHYCLQILYTTNFLIENVFIYLFHCFLFITGCMLSKFHNSCCSRHFYTDHVCLNLVHIEYNLYSINSAIDYKYFSVHKQSGEMGCGLMILLLWPHLWSKHLLFLFMISI